MKNCLLSFAVVLALLVGAPAYSQYMYMDVDNDGVNSQNTATGDDALDAADTGADVWLDLTKNRDGTPISCTDGSNTLSLIAYEFTIEQSGSGSVSFDGWANNMAGFVTSGILGDSNPASVGFDAASGEAWVFLIATNPTDWPDPGLHKLGRLALTVTGTPKLDFVPVGAATINLNAGTSFGTECFSPNSGLSTWYLNDEWTGNDGTASPTPIVEDTWGKIKKLYE